MKPEQASWRGARSFCEIKLKYFKNEFFQICVYCFYLNIIFNFIGIYFVVNEARAMQACMVLDHFAIKLKHFKN